MRTLRLQSAVAVAPISTQLLVLPAPPSISARRPYQARAVEVWLLGITIVIGGQYFGWNTELENGVVSYIISYLMIATAYIAQMFCSAEISGVLPFAGGAYGIARCSLGSFMGFVVGCIDAVEYVVYVSASLLAFADMVIRSSPSLAGKEPVIWLIFLMVALFLHLRSIRTFWIANAVLGTISLVLLVIFCLGSLPFISFQENAKTSTITYTQWGGLKVLLRVLPKIAWFFVGIEAVSMASDQIVAPTKEIPVAQLRCVGTLTLTGIVVLFITVSLPPGLSATATALVPFNAGFEHMLNVSSSVATLFSLPATFATAFGFMWCHAKLVAAMAESNLLPWILGLQIHPTDVSPNGTTPVVGHVSGAIVAFGLCLLVYISPTVNVYLANVCIALAFVSYIAQAIGYIVLKLGYGKLMKNAPFASPLDIWGAIYALWIWIVGLVAVLFFQDNGHVELLVVGILLGLITITYFGYVRGHETTSAHEETVLRVKFALEREGDRSRPSQRPDVVAPSAASTLAEARPNSHNGLA